MKDTFKVRHVKTHKEMKQRRKEREGNNIFTLSSVSLPLPSFLPLESHTKFSVKRKGGKKDVFLLTQLNGEERVNFKRNKEV